MLAALSRDYGMKPCPFCGCDRVRLNEYRQHGLHFQVICLGQGCGAKGPRRYDGDEAMEAWNERGRMPSVVGGR